MLVSVYCVTIKISDNSPKVTLTKSEMKTERSSTTLYYMAAGTDYLSRSLIG